MNEDFLLALKRLSIVMFPDFTQHNVLPKSYAR